MLIATQYQLLRFNPLREDTCLTFDQQPVGVFVLIDETKFEELGNALIEDVNGFHLTEGVQYLWTQGNRTLKLRGWKDAPVSILFVFEMQEDGRTRYCPTCGVSAVTGCSHNQPTRLAPSSIEKENYINPSIINI